MVAIGKSVGYVWNKLSSYGLAIHKLRYYLNIEQSVEKDRNVLTNGYWIRTLMSQTGG